MALKLTSGVWTCMMVMAALAASVNGFCDGDLGETYDISGSHTGCLPLGDTVLSASDQADIVDEHNYYRASTAPSASDMLALTWDADLATLAQKWTDNCDYHHDENGDRNFPGRFKVGQNMGQGHQSWAGVIKAWHDEEADFPYGDAQGVQDIKDAGEVMIGHYTAVVWAKTSLVGCGVTVCPGGVFHVCNYGPAGNLGSVQHVPFSEGPKCDSCPDFCDDQGLCDCKGRVCQNGGSLNLNTCTCDCTVTFVGDSCETLECPATDGNSAYCQLYFDKYANPCIYSNVRDDVCRRTCCLEGK